MSVYVACYTDDVLIKVVVAESVIWCTNNIPECNSFTDVTYAYTTPTSEFISKSDEGIPE